MASFMYSEPRNRPLQHLVLLIRHLVPKPCIDSDRALPEELPIPQLRPALRRMTEQTVLRSSRAPLDPHARLLAADVIAEDHRAGLRREQTSDVLRELELGFFGTEEVEDGAYGEGGDVAAEGVK